MPRRIFVGMFFFLCVVSDTWAQPFGPGDLQGLWRGAILNCGTAQNPQPCLNVVNVAAATPWTGNQSLADLMRGAFGTDVNGRPILNVTGVVSVTSFANPTANVGGTAVNGSATTAMRSDAAPALAVNQTIRVCQMNAGADNASAVLVDADLGPQGRQCFVPYPATLVEVDVAADGGTPQVIVRKNCAGTQTDLLSAALATAASGGIACSRTTAVTGLDGATTCSATAQNTSIAAGCWIELKSGTAGGTAKRMSIAVMYTMN